MKGRWQRQEKKETMGHEKRRPPTFDCSIAPVTEQGKSHAVHALPSPQRTHETPTHVTPGRHSVHNGSVARDRQAPLTEHAARAPHARRGTHTRTHACTAPTLPSCDAPAMHWLAKAQACVCGARMRVCV